MKTSPGNRQRSLFEACDSLPNGWITRRQLTQAQQRHPGMMLMFAVNERYLLVAQDAFMAAKLLGLPLDHSSKPPTVSFPSHALEVQLRKLLSAGHRVAICDTSDEPY